MISEEATIIATQPTASPSHSDIPIANIYYLLCYAWNVLKEHEQLAEAGALSSTSLIELFARVLISGSRRLIRRGFDRGYLEENGVIAGVRGKLDVGATVRGSHLARGRSMCTWDELDYNTLPNQILKSTLNRLYDHGGLQQDCLAHVHDLLRWLAPVQDLRLRGDHFRRVQIHRNNRIYTFLLHVCEFIHEQWLPDEQGQGRRFRNFVREGLPRLFESFVRNFYRQELPAGWNVDSFEIQWNLDYPPLDPEHFLPSMQTDVCLHGHGRAIILDTKFYAEALKTRFGDVARLSNANLYQLFTYLRQRACKPGWERAEGILLYPRTNRDIAVEFTSHGHRIRAVTLDLMRPWESIRNNLLRLALEP